MSDIAPRLAASRLHHSAWEVDARMAWCLVRHAFRLRAHLSESKSVTTKRDAVLEEAPARFLTAAGAAIEP